MAIRCPRAHPKTFHQALRARGSCALRGSFAIAAMRRSRERAGGRESLAEKAARATSPRNFSGSWRQSHRVNDRRIALIELRHRLLATRVYPRYQHGISYDHVGGSTSEMISSLSELRRTAHFRLAKLNDIGIPKHESALPRDIVWQEPAMAPTAKRGHRDRQAPSACVQNSPAGSTFPTTPGQLVEPCRTFRSFTAACHPPARNSQCHLLIPVLIPAVKPSLAVPGFAISGHDKGRFHSWARFFGSGIARTRFLSFAFVPCSGRRGMVR